MKSPCVKLLLGALAFTVHQAFAQTGLYSLSSGTDSQSGQTYAATAADQSSIWVYGAGSLTLANATLTKTGNASSSAGNYQASSQYGINAGLLAGSYNGTTGSAGTVIITGTTTVSTGAAGANGLFATFTGSSISITGGSITTTGTFSHGADVTYGGLITLNGTTINTSGASGSAGLSTDFGGGTITATSVSVTTAGSGSPAIYSTGTISATSSTLKANGGFGAIIDGGNAINLTSSSLTALSSGVRVFRSAPGTTAATVVVTGGSTTASGGDVFFLDGSSSAAAIGNFTLKGGATVSASTGILVHATVGAATTHTTNAATFIADGETVSGNVVTDAYSTITSTLQNGTTLSGFINNAATGTDNLTIDSTSAWSVSAASTLNSLTTSGTISGAGVVTSSAFTVKSGTISASLAGTGALTKSTTGAATLAGTNSYGGATMVSAGALIVSGSLATNNTTSVTDGAVLDGSGTVGVVNVTATTPGTTAGGAVDPGNGAASVASNGTVTGNGATGTLKTGNFSLGTGTHLAMQLGGLSTGAYDQVGVTGTITLAGDLQLSLINGFTGSVGDKFFLLLNDSTDLVATHFSNGPTISAGGETFLINYADNGDGGTVANDVSLTVQAVPEPSAWLLLLGGGLTFAACARRR